LLLFERKVLLTICGPKIENGVYRRRYKCPKYHEDKQIALRVTRPEDLPQKVLFRAKPNGRGNQGRPKSRWADGVNSDSLALRVRDWTHCAQNRQTWRDFLQQALTRYWL
jgi:hypothetical protein